MSPSPTNDADFVNRHPGITRLKSGTWLAKIQHPISKVWVLLGTYATPGEAEDTCTRKKMEYESPSVQKSTPSSFHTDLTDFEKHPGIKRMKSGKWTAQINHNNERIRLGIYTTPKEAAEAYNMSRLELNSQKTGCLRRVSGSGSGSVYQVSKGKWKAVIKRRKVRHHLGTYATAEDAQEAINLERCELGVKADTEKTGFSQQTEIENPITKARTHLGTLDSADEAYNSMMCEFDITVRAHKKSRFEDDPIAQGKTKIDSACVSDELFVPTDGSSVIKAIKEEEIGDRMINVNAESVPIFVTEIKREFDLGIVDSYGQLVGEYSSLDDDLWLCRYEDAAT